jgi:hypothetical protein
MGTFIRSNEITMDYRVERIVHLSKGKVELEVAELRPIPTPSRSSHPGAAWFRSIYVVDGQKISMAMIEAFGMPKRVASYPYPTPC